MAPISQIQSGGGILFLPSDRHQEGMDSLPTIILFSPAEGHQSNKTGIANTNIQKILKKQLVDKEGYSSDNQNCKRK